MPNYQNGKIYSIRSHQTDDIYIGSTTNPLSKRFSSHKSKYDKWVNGSKDYTSSFELFKYNDVYYELIECFPCNSKDELYKREGEITRETENCVNKFIAGRTAREWRDDNKEVIKEKRKQYCEDNKEYYKEYYKLKNDKYREDNKEKIKQKRAVKYTCECGSTLRKSDKSRHDRSKKHQDWLNSQ